MDNSRIKPEDVLFERYLVSELLGEGGMGQVWAAKDLKLKRPVAIKIISRKLADHPAYVARFEREMTAVARLKHPNIVQLYHADITPDGRPYMIMERIHGVTLRVLIETVRRVDLVSAVYIAIQIADALGLAHRAGIWHRDIKPENVMVSDDGDAWLLDFGIFMEVRTPEERAKGKSGERHGTGRLGTIGYMPPEQAQNQTSDQRGDFYQLGVVLYEMLAGRKPYPDVREGSETDMLYAHAFSEPRPLMEVVPDCPEWIWPIVVRLLEKDPDARYDDVNELIGDLRSGLRESVPPGHPMTRKIVHDRHEVARKKAFARRGSLTSVSPEGTTSTPPPSSPDERKSGGTEPMLGGWASTGPVAGKAVANGPAVNMTKPLPEDFVPPSPYSARRLVSAGSPEATAPLPPTFGPPPSSPLPWSQPALVPPSSSLTHGVPIAATSAGPPFVGRPVPTAPPVGPPPLPLPDARPFLRSPSLLEPPRPAPLPFPTAPPASAVGSAPRRSSLMLRIMGAAVVGVSFGMAVVLGFRLHSGTPPAEERRAPTSASASAPTATASAAPVSVATAEPSVAAVEPRPPAVAAATAAPAKAARPPSQPTMSSPPVSTVMIGGKPVTVSRVPLFGGKPPVRKIPAQERELF